MSELPPDNSSIAAVEVAVHEARGTFRGPSLTRARLERASRQLELLALRSLDLADRVAAGELAFLDAVDVAYEAAVWAGLTSTVGDDVVQATLAAAFANARRPT
jgi:hypothetical protein